VSSLEKLRFAASTGQHSCISTGAHRVYRIGTRFSLPSPLPAMHGECGERESESERCVWREGEGLKTLKVRAERGWV
jgi:hypothetical protein